VEQHIHIKLLFLLVLGILALSCGSHKAWQNDGGATALDILEDGASHHDAGCLKPVDCRAFQPSSGSVEIEREQQQSQQQAGIRCRVLNQSAPT
jgi:hypothetical protein